MKTALSLILAALTTTATAAAPVANATETKINPVALEYATEYRTTTAEVTGIAWYPTHTTSNFVTPDGNEWAVCDELNPESSYLVVFDTMGTADLTDDEVIGMVPIQK
ncbi:hypothetical protein [Hominenteromicrobium sp.]|uniref:hypothetical protein n=1 Tax=Hominenteromicrobium sp. TaxID=3073581 RepID=UPI003A90E3D8